ncbi:hypothetical protein SASPL_134641 [Salvia splendens]|uniref:Endoplasmic reticulum-Golgi intermediate compartment protein 3 n=1 Tax=Salvia splendens TaxID=180675 RepID=A0A8X8ZF79_SALSN|nr:hypothetical protein SASPL_134641 [Salvia splendens]
MMESLIGKIRNLDAYPKINQDFYSRTLSGGFITLTSTIVMILLFISELSMCCLINDKGFNGDCVVTKKALVLYPCLCFSVYVVFGGSKLWIRLYLHAVTETKLVVDTSRSERLRINFDVTFPALPCSIVSLDAMDISGEQHLDVRHDITKKRIDALGNVIETRADTIGSPKIDRPLQNHGGRLEHNETYCGSCFGAEACKREGFLQRIKDEEGEGCNIYGFLDVNKVAGNFHFAPGKSFEQSNVHVHDLLAFQKDSFNLTHKINRIAFGDFFPGVVNPLDRAEWTQHTPNAMYQYFLKVVPTVFKDIDGHTIQSNQFSVTEHVRGAELGRLQALPGVFFFYELSPIKVTFTETHVSFLHFLTNVCAIIGGIFTVSGIVDSLVYHGHRAIKKKMELGKLT